MFINVLTQVIILFILITLGVILSKAKILDDKGVKSMTEIVLTIVIPCVTIKTFIREFNMEDLKNLGISFLIVFLMHVGFILLSILLLRDKNKDSQIVLQYSAIFSNCGFMALPLQQAILGDVGVFYCTTFIAMFNIFIWTYGIILVSGDIKSLGIKKILLNPGLIAVLIGLIIFIFSIPIPKIISEPISYMAALNTPLPMIIIGYHLSKSNVLKGLCNLKALFAILLRLVVFPVIAIVVMWLCGVKNDMLIAEAICACAPVAAVATMFSAKYNRDTELSVNLVSISTLLSLITMPLIITFAEKLTKL